MCEFCVTAHKRINALLEHQILSLTEVKKLGSKALVKPTFCVKHSDERLKLFCDTCQKTICRDCTIVDHREHKYNFVADVVERERKVVHAILEETKAKDSAVEEGLKAVQAMESCVEAKIAEVSKEVDVFYDQEVKALECMRTTLKHDITTQGQVKLKALGNQKEMLAFSLAQLLSSSDFAERALADGDDMELLSMKQQLIQRLSQLNASQFYCKPCNSDYLKLQMDKTVSDIGKMATLHYIPDTTKCMLSMVGGEEGISYPTFAGQPVDFMLVIKGGTAVTEPETGCMVRASVEREEQGKSHELPVHDNGDGSYLFSYRPENHGLYTLSVTVEGENVFDSPFIWKVKPKIKDTNELKIVLSDLRLNQGELSDQGKQCWKLKYLGSMPGKSQVEIGLNFTYRDGCGNRNDRYHWCCQDNDNTRHSFLRRVHSNQIASTITSLKNGDIFSVYLNWDSQKLVIYNHRSQQGEVFTNITRRQQIHPIISPCSIEPSGNGFTLDIE